MSATSTATVPVRGWDGNEYDVEMDQVSAGAPRYVEQAIGAPLANGSGTPAHWNSAIGTSPATLAGGNTNRAVLVITNDPGVDVNGQWNVAGAMLYVLLRAGTVSPTNYDWAIPPGGTLELAGQTRFTGATFQLCGSAAVGSYNASEILP